MAGGLSTPGWQPFTPGGVARFAHARPSRLIAVCGVIAMICTASIINFVRVSWVPVVDEAIRGLPREAMIRDGYLHWPGPAVKLAANPFLAILANPRDEVLPRESSDVQVELTTTSFRLRSALGYTPIPYPRHWIVSLAGEEVAPLWGAGKPAFFASLGAVALLWLVLSWGCLATIYCWPARVIAFYCDRDLRIGSAWRLAFAAQMPGALLMSFGLTLYGLREISALLLGIITAAHFLPGILYILFAPLRLPAAPDAPVKNPFGTRKTPVGKANPFA